MNITFLVGNGFDISVGAKTSYRDFYNWYCEQPSETENIEQFKKDIQNDETIDWSDFELALGKYTNRFLVGDEESFLECHDDAHVKLIEYLNTEEKRFGIYFNCLELTAEKLSVMRDGISNYYQELKPKENILLEKIVEGDKGYSTKVRFISFNYTDILDHYISAISDVPLKKWLSGNAERVFSIEPDVLHIHGRPEHFSILGVDNEAQIENQDLLQSDIFAQAMIKSRGIDMIGETWYDDAENIIESSQIYCVFGMSLGASDARWWKHILKCLEQHGNRQLIIFWHTNEALDRRLTTKWARVERKIMDLLIEYSDGTEETIRSIKAQTHIVFNSTKLFPMESLIEHKEPAVV